VPVLFVMTAEIAISLMCNSPLYIFATINHWPKIIYLS